MKRILAGVSAAAMLVALIPATVSAERVTRYQDHHVGVSCESAFDGGLASTSIDSSSAFGDFGQAAVWLDPAIAFDDPPSLSGSTETVHVVEGTAIVTADATFPVADPDGIELGQATLEASMTRVGDPVPISEPSFGNHHSKTQGTVQTLEGSATLHLPGRDVSLSGCSGDITDISVFDTNPHSFVIDTQGVSIDCFWETADSAASFFAIEDQFGLTADAFLGTAQRELFAAGGATGSIDSVSLHATVPVQDPSTGDPFSATAAATFVPNGNPVASTHVSATARQRLIEQALIPDGQLAFSTGDTFVLDDEHCDAVAFQNRTVNTSPAGPKAGGRAPANDTAAGAFAIAPGDRFNVQTGAASYDAELQTTTCPEGIGDQMGRTLWYTIEGTGDPITIDSAGSGFDTIIASYEGEPDALTEIGCDDDVFSNPVGSTFQAALTIDTQPGVIYHIQVGGFMNFFGGDPEFGRLRLRVS